MTYLGAVAALGGEEGVEAEDAVGVAVVGHEGVATDGSLAVGALEALLVPLQLRPLQLLHP